MTYPSRLTPPWLPFPTWVLMHPRSQVWNDHPILTLSNSQGPTLPLLLDPHCLLPRSQAPEQCTTSCLQSIHSSHVLAAGFWGLPMNHLPPAHCALRCFTTSSYSPASPSLCPPKGRSLPPSSPFLTSETLL